MRTWIAIRVALLACGWLGCAWSGGVRAQALSCTANMPSPRIHIDSEIFVNRLTPIGPIASAPAASHFGARATCTGGSIGQPIEIALRVHPSLVSRPNPFGAGLLLETSVPGIGIVLQTPTPAMITSAFQVVHTATRNGLTHQALANMEVRAQVARHDNGVFDLNNDYPLHGIPLVQMAWRAPGVQDDWQYITTWSLETLVGNPENIISETCFIGNDPMVAWRETKDLGKVDVGEFPGIGQEAPSRIAAGTVVLTCRNYAGGFMTVTSATAHPTMPGVMRNALTGPGAAAGMGVRIRHGLDGAAWDFHTPWPISAQGHRISDILHFDYHARYLQTEPVVRPGQFKSTVTFTVHYD